jgi:hypothetical protein
MNLPWVSYGQPLNENPRRISPTRVFLFNLQQLLFTALAATFSVLLAAIGRRRRCRRRADERHKSSNQKKIFHKILLLSFLVELGHEFHSCRAGA